MRGIRDFKSRTIKDLEIQALKAETSDASKRDINELDKYQWKLVYRVNESTLLKRIQLISHTITCIILVISLVLLLNRFVNQTESISIRNRIPADRTYSVSNSSSAFTLGIIANEFFDPKFGRTGGFGMASKMVAGVFQTKRDLGHQISLVFIFASPYQGNQESKLLQKVHHSLFGFPLLSMIPAKKNHLRRDSLNALKSAKIDVFLLIDFRNDYNNVLKYTSEPIILWARDPRTNQQIQNLEGIRIPGYFKQPQGVHAPRATGAKILFEKVEYEKDHRGDLSEPRRMIIGVTWIPALWDRVFEAYDIEPFGNVLGLNNVLTGCSRDKQLLDKHPTPAVIFIGRLDPYKRPWLMIELAKKFPDVEFWVFGRRHFYGKGSYDIEKDSGKLPKNVKLFGQISGEEKFEHLQKAWFLISTSAHEGLAINYLEALQCGTPVLSTVDPGGVVSSYGVFVGEFSGSGLQGMESLTKGFEKLLRDEKFRHEKGALGRKHVLQTHNADRFWKALMTILSHLELPRSTPAGMYISEQVNSVRKGL